MEKQTKQQLNSNNYLELWKWFQADAAKIKDRMWTMTTFFYMALGTLLGFAANHMWIDASSGWSLELQKPFTLFIVAMLGCFGSGYGYNMLKQYAEHVRRGWNRANYIRSQINGFDKIWNNNDSKIIEEDMKRGKSMPKIIGNSVIPMIVFFFILLALVILILILNKN